MSKTKVVQLGSLDGYKKFTAYRLAWLIQNNTPYEVEYAITIDDGEWEDDRPTVSIPFHQKENLTMPVDYRLIGTRSSGVLSIMGHAASSGYQQVHLGTDIEKYLNELPTGSLIEFTYYNMPKGSERGWVHICAEKLSDNEYSNREIYDYESQ